MKYQYHGWLFGCYNSRGGSTFMEEKPLAKEPLNEAAKRYAVQFDAGDDAETIAAVLAQDLIGHATIHSDTPLESSMDLDYAMRDDDDPDKRHAFVEGHSDAEPGMEFIQDQPGMEDQRWNQHFTIWFAEKPPEGIECYEPRWDDDGAGLIFFPQDRDSMNDFA